MARDNQQKKLSKKDMKKSDKKIVQKKKKIVNSDSDSNSGGSDSESDEMDEHEYRKFISKIFPSKHIDKKVKAGERVKKALKKELHDDDEDDEDDDSSEEKPVRRSKRFKKANKKKVEQEDDDEEEDDEELEEEWETDEEEKNSKKNKNSNKTKKTSKSNKKNKKSKKAQEEEESEDDEETLGSEDTEDDEHEDDDDDEEDEDDDEEFTIKGKGTNKVNIIFTIGGAEDEDDDEWDSEEDYDSDYGEYEDCDDDITEDEDESVSTDTSEEEEEDEDEDEEADSKRKKKNKNSIKKEKAEKKAEKKVEKSSKKKILSDKQGKQEKENSALDELSNSIKTKDNNETKDVKSTEDVLKQLKELLTKNPGDKSIQKCISVYEEDIKKQTVKNEKKEKKHKEKNMRIFRKIIRDKNSMNDFSFYEKLDLTNQKKIIKELREINKITRIEKPYRMTLLESGIPVHFKAAAMKKINSLRYMEPGSGEFYKIKNWVDTFMRIPFGKTDGLPITIDDGVEKCHDFMENAQKILDEAVYGLNDAKMQIMQMLGQLLTNPKAIGTAIAIHGPPGTGKTSLVKEGISKILNRPFAFIALGGATDSSFLEGHGYTYEGSTWGKIVQILIDSKCMNPVIYFDELDKISDTPRGEEIAGILTHLTDTSQNSQFHDKYFAEINFDLSKCLFIFSYNDESKVNAILKDRMYRIKTKGYSQKEKTVISNSYLLPRIKEQVKFADGEIIIPDTTISHIIETHCQKEDGVRNLKRCLEIIYTKLNLYRLMKPGSNLFEGEMSLKVEFPFTVTKDIVDKLIKKEQENLSALYAMYV
jgi:ATP-dependent Lon protease